MYADHCKHKNGLNVTTMKHDGLRGAIEGGHTSCFTWRTFCLMISFSTAGMLVLYVAETSIAGCKKMSH